MKRENRTILGGEIRSVDDDAKTFTALVLNYGVTDTFGTQFRQGCFQESIDTKMPRSTWAHDWTRPIGKVTAVRDTGDGLEMDFQLADFDAVPDARMAYSLIKDQIIDGFSIGFEPTDVRDSKGRAVTANRMAPGDVCYAGNLIEVSPVLVPSVPGTKTLDVRSNESPVAKETVAELLVRFSRGDVDLADALAELKAEGRAQAKDANPHDYQPTNGDGSVCANCGGMPDATIHVNGRSAVIVSGMDIPVTDIQATDAALDEALIILNALDLTTVPPEVAQAIALVNAASASIDNVMRATGIYDADDSLSYSAEDDTEITAALALIDSRIDRRNN